MRKNGGTVREPAARRLLLGAGGGGRQVEWVWLVDECTHTGKDTHGRGSINHLFEC